MKLKIRYERNENMINGELLETINKNLELFYLKNAFEELKKEGDSIE